jgi:hypothetical protein
MLILVLTLLPLLNIAYYEYRVIKDKSKSPKDITNAWVTLQFIKRYK